MTENAVDTAAIKQRLLARHRELIEVDGDSQDSREAVQLDQSAVGRLSRMDAMQAQAMAQASHRRRGIELSRIGAALQRLDDGDYGYCVSCGEAIDPRRLDFDAAATQCIRCADDTSKNR